MMHVYLFNIRVFEVCVFGSLLLVDCLVFGDMGVVS